MLDSMPSGHLLAITLEMAVPLHIGEVSAWTPEARVEFCRAHAAEISENADCLLHKVPGKTARVFNLTARAIACLAFQPGGVTVAGQHWEIDGGDR